MTTVTEAGSRTAALVGRAERLFPGGVNSSVRTFRAVGRPPSCSRAAPDGMSAMALVGR